MARYARASVRARRVRGRPLKCINASVAARNAGDVPGPSAPFSIRRWGRFMPAAHRRAGRPARCRQRSVTSTITRQWKSWSGSPLRADRKLEIVVPNSQVVSPGCFCSRARRKPTAPARFCRGRRCGVARRAGCQPARSGQAASRGSRCGLPRPPQAPRTGSWSRGH